MNYFDKIPNIIYNGHTVKNLLSRARLSDKTRNNKVLFYPYTIKEDERADILSDYYYDDPGYAWLIYMTNNIVDPYYEMPLNNDDLNNLIISKYGNIETAQRKVKYYRNNWASNVDQISIDYFESLPSYAAKYFDPVVGPSYTVRGYVRKRHDDIVSTNQILTLTLSAPIELIGGEEVKVSDSIYGFVIQSSSSNTVTIQHTVGEFTIGQSIQGRESLNTATITDITVITRTIAYNEALYWDPVTYYDYENEQNEIKKQIKLIDARYRNNVESELKRVLGS